MRCMEPWEPLALAYIAVYCSLSAVSDLWAVRHCVVFGDATLDAIQYRGGGGLYRVCVVFVHTLFPWKGIHTKVRSWGFWCGRFSWPCGWA